MLLLVNKAYPSMSKYLPHPHLGNLVTPRSGQRVQPFEDARIPWAADNGAFAGFEERRYLRMLDKLQGMHPLFVAAPDVVADARTTLSLYPVWEQELRRRGFRVAFVAQDGLDEGWTVPWPVIDCLFIGGTDEFKMGDFAAGLCRRARELRRWVHVGRVNTLSRLRWCYEIGADSVDGTNFSWYMDVKLPRALRLLEELHG